MKKRLLLTLLPLALLVAACSGGNGGGDETTSAEPASTSGAVATTTSGAAATSTSAAAGTSTSAAPATQTTSAPDTTPAATSSAAPAPTIPTTGYAVVIGTQIIELQADPAAQNTGAFENREQGYLNLVSNVTAGEAITFYCDGEAYPYVNAAGDDTAGGVYNNVVKTDSGFAIQSTVATEHNFYTNLWKANDSGEKWITFFLQGGANGEHGDDGSTPSTTDGKYTVLVGTTEIKLTKNETPADPSYEEYMALGVSVTSGQQIQIRDNESRGQQVWTIENLDGASTGFAISDHKLVCTADGVYDIYLKLKYEADQIYIGAHSA